MTNIKSEADYIIDQVESIRNSGEDCRFIEVELDRIVDSARRIGFEVKDDKAKGM